MTQTTQTTQTANSIRSEQKEAPLENRVLKDEELEVVVGADMDVGSLTDTIKQQQQNSMQQQQSNIEARIRR
jgi:hypothetical protein